MTPSPPQTSFGADHVSGTEGLERGVSSLNLAAGRKAPPSFSPRRKSNRRRRAMATRREQGYQQFGPQRLGTLADVWPGART